MTLTAENVVVPLTGHIYNAPVGTAFPTELDPPAAPWVEVGYTATDGLEFSYNVTKQDVNAWQSLDPLRVIRQSRVLGFKGTLLEWTLENLMLAFGGGGIDRTATVGTYTFPAAGDTDEFAILLDFEDGTRLFRIGWPRMEQDGDITVPLGREDAAKLPVSFRNLAADTDPFVMSDHPDWVTAST